MDFVDPLDTIPQENERVSAHTLEIPEHDRSLFEQLRSSTKITDISDEIAFNKYLRILLQREFEKWSIDSKRVMVDKITGELRKFVALSEVDREILEGRIMKHLPSQSLTVNQTKMLSKLLETSGALAEKHKKITEGMEIKVNISDAGVIQKLLTYVIFPVVDRNTWAAIRHRAQQFAPNIGISAALNLDGD